jgi:hypothetical protein
MDTNYFRNKHPSFSGLIGIAKADITPPVNIYSRNWGAAKYDTADGIHMPLQLTCITFQALKDDKPLILIAADLGWWKNAADEWRLRSKILDGLQTEVSHLMFCLSHTHAGPSISSNDKANKGGELIIPYLDFLIKQAIDTATQAILEAKSRTLSWQYGKCALAVNRDLEDIERKRFIVGFNPNETADDTLLVGRITDADNNVNAVIVNYACHPTTLGGDNRLISPDYVGSMRALIEKETQSTCLFLQGASGDLSPIEQYVGDVKLAESYGQQLGYAVLSTLAGMLPPEAEVTSFKVVESGAPLAFWEQSTYTVSTSICVTMAEIELPLKELPSLAEIEQQWQSCEDRILKERLWRKRGVRIAVGDGINAKINLWVWRLGDSFLIGQPNEAYSEYQIKLREKLFPNAVAVINVANGHIGYLPTQNLYDKEIYSVWQTPFAVGSLETLTNRTIDVAQAML